MFFYCIVPVAPVRSEPSHKAEMVTQLLFGEAISLTETLPGGWLKIQCSFDNYVGFITASHITATEYDENWHQRFATGWMNTVMLNNTMMRVPFGSLIPADLAALDTPKHNWDFTKTEVADAGMVTTDRLATIAQVYLNTPYLWGGKSIYGIDCSGLVQQVFKWANILLPRDAWQQAEAGTALHFLQEARFGDVAFFDNDGGRITHTGILLNENSIIHASGKVRIDAIDTDGIVNLDTGARTHHLRIIKRFLLFV